MYNICEYCGSKILTQDRNCVKCGAPISLSEKPSTFGEVMKIIEDGICEKEIVTGGCGNNLLYTYNRILKLTNLDSKGNCVIMNQ